MDTEDKATLRARFTARRRAMSDDEIAQARAAVCTAVLQRCAERGWHRVAAYEPLRTEPGSVELLVDLRDRGIEVLVPVVLPDRDLDWRRWESDVLLGVDAIADVDVVLAPALAVARDGTRLGRGGGSYDRALARAAGRPVAALLYAAELVDSLPSDPWDRPVTAVVTPAGWEELA